MLNEENEKLKDKLLESNAKKIDENKFYETDKQLKDVMRQISQLQEENESKDVMLSTLKQRFTDLEVQNARLTNENRDIAKESETRLTTIKNNHTQSMLDKNKEIKSLQHELENLKSENQRIKLEGATWSERVIVLEKNNENSEDKHLLEQSKIQNDELRSQISVLQFEIVDKKNKLKQQKDEVQGFREQTEKEISDRDNYIKKIEEELKKNNENSKSETGKKVKEDENSSLLNKKILELNDDIRSNQDKLRENSFIIEKLNLQIKVLEDKNEQSNRNIVNLSSRNFQVDGLNSKNEDLQSKVSQLSKRNTLLESEITSETQKLKTEIQQLREAKFKTDFENKRATEQTILSEKEHQKIQQQYEQNLKENERLKQEIEKLASSQKAVN